MYLTQTNIIRHLSKDQYSILKEMCIYSNNLYNYGLYNVRQQYFNAKTYLTYFSNAKLCKDNENYKLLQAGISNQVLNTVDHNFKSFFALIKKAKTGSYDYKDLKIPHYHKKGSMFLLILQSNSISIKNGLLKLPMSREFRKTHTTEDIYISIPKHLLDKEIKQIQIIPCTKGKYFKIQYIYKQEIEPKHLNTNNKLGIDLGVNNLATCVPTNNETPFILDGRKLQSINHY